jgi:hypothetical protein
MTHMSATYTAVLATISASLIDWQGHAGGWLFYIGVRRGYPFWRILKCLELGQPLPPLAKNFALKLYIYLRLKPLQNEINASNSACNFVRNDGVRASVSAC